MTFAILFSDKPIPCAPKFHLDNYQLEIKKERDFRGVTLDDKINVKAHTIKIINVITKSTDMLLRLSLNRLVCCSD